MSAEAFGAYQLSGANAVDALKILDAAIAIDVTPLLSKIQCPALVVHHRDDRVIPMEYAQDLAAGIKGARFVSFPGGHIPPVDAILASQKAVTDFIRVDAAPAKATASTDSTFRTVLFTDIVGHTEMMRRLGDDKGRAVLREHEQVTRDVLKANAGSEVKTMGDGFMASFTSVTKAVQCAIALQRAFADRGAGDPDSSGVRFQPDDPNTPGVRFQPDRGGAGGTALVEPIIIRVGLNAGEPIQEDGPDGRSDLFGETVILAARIAAQASGGEVLASMAVRELCAGKGFLFADVGEKAMRGFEDPVHVFEVRWRD